MTGLIKFQIRDFRGIVAFDATPNDHSVTLRGANGTGKSSVIDALWWGMGGALDGGVIRNGADRAEVVILFDEYQITRSMKRDGKPSLVVKHGKDTKGSPTELLRGLIGAIARQTFSTLDREKQTAILLRLAPGLNCADLDARRLALYEERREIGVFGKALRAQLDGIPDAAPPEGEIGEERPVVDVVDVAEIASLKAPIARRIAANDAVRAAHQRLVVESHAAHRASATADRDLAAARAAYERALEAQRVARERSDLRAQEVAESEAHINGLVDPDPSVIDREIAVARETNAAARREAEEHNRGVRERAAAAADAARLSAARKAMTDRVEAARVRYEESTNAIEAIDAEKAARIAAAPLPVPGISIRSGDVVVDDGTHGAVPVGALNTAARMRLDVAIGAALGYRLIAVRDASLLDDDARAAVAAFAAERGVRLISEIVASGEPLTAVIEEGEST